MSAVSDVQQLLDDVTRAGGAVRVVSGRLQVKTPPGGLPDTLRAALKERAPDLVRRLSPPESWTLRDRNRDWWAVDPRPDLQEDSALWSRLLAAVHDGDGGPYGNLYGGVHCARCLGARIVLSPHGAKIEQGECPSDSYAAIRTAALLPNADRLRLILRTLA